MISKLSPLCLGVALALTPQSFAEDVCAKLDAVIEAGQADISWENLLKPRPGILRDSGFNNAHQLLAPFDSCRIRDDVDNVKRANSVLYCSILENEGEKVTEETRAAFMSEAFAQYSKLIECMDAKDDWLFYQANQVTMTGSLKREAQTRLEDGIGITFKIDQFGYAPLYRMNLTMELRTVPRDYR